MINPSPIASQLSLNAGDHEELKILLQIRLIASRVNQKLRNKEGYIVFLKRNFTRFLRPFDLVGKWDGWPRSHGDRGPSLGGDHGLNCTMNQPQPRGDRATIELQS